MRSFGGEFSRGPKVALGGKSLQSESRDQVLERTRLERELRKQQKLEIKSATTIQAVWRAHHSREQAKAATKAAWQRRYGSAGQLATPADAGAVDCPYLRELEFFANPAAWEDCLLVSSACRNVLSPLTDAAPPSLLAAAAHAAATAVLRAQRLVSLALDALVVHSHAFQAQLRAPRQGLASAAAGDPVTPLLEAVIALVSVDTWKPCLGVEGAAAAVANILARLVRDRPGLFEKLALIAESGCPEAAESGVEGEAPRRGRVSAAETLCTQLVVRYFSSQAAVQRELSGSPGSSRPAALLCLPLLPQRCHSLAPLMPRLWRATVALPLAVLVDMLPLQLATASQPQQQQNGRLGAPSRVAAAAALLGNLIEDAPAALSGPPTLAQQEACLHFLELASALLTLLPWELFGSGAEPGGDSYDEEDPDSLAEASEAAAAVLGPATALSSISGGSNGAAVLFALPPGVVRQLERVSDQSLLAAVCTAALPAASADSAAMVAAWGAAPEVSAAAVRRTCTFLAQVVFLLPGQRRKGLLALSLRAELVPRLWFSHFRRPGAATAVQGSTADPTCDPGWMLPVWIFAECGSMAIQALGDDGLYEKGQPLPLAEVYAPGDPPSVLRLLRSALWHVLWQEAPPSPGGWPRPAAALRGQVLRAAGRLMAQLHDRNGRRPFAPPEAFYADGLPAERFHSEVALGLPGVDAAEGDVLYEGSSRAWTLLAHAPFLVPFVERAKVFQRLVSSERARYREPETFAGIFGGGGRRFVTVQRGRVLADAFGALGEAPPEELRGRVRIAFLSEMGTEEAGVDGGGIFKEFLEAVIKEGFDPGAGLFLSTADNKAYPNPHAALAVAGAPRLLEFLGRMLGKALWEGILVELPLAPFFLKKVRGMPCDVDDLPTLDPQLARSLASLRSFEGDVASLGLTFSVTDDQMGRPTDVELFPGGREVAVTSANAALFIHRVADFKLNAQLRTPAASFLRGLHALIPRRWVRMFNDRELQELISGAEGGAALDLADLQRNVQYAGGYSAEHPVIQALWEAMASFTPPQQADFLRFVTSCPRPPLLGFGYLEPPLCIQMANGGVEGRLPTAATCMNLLKLPAYPGGPAQVRERLLYAVQAGAGFELS